MPDQVRGTYLTCSPRNGPGLEYVLLGSLTTYLVGLSQKIGGKKELVNLATTDRIAGYVNTNRQLIVRIAYSQGCERKSCFLPCFLPCSLP
jgi:hypothetical protein